MVRRIACRSFSANPAIDKRLHYSRKTPDLVPERVDSLVAVDSPQMAPRSASNPLHLVECFYKTSV